MSPSILLLTCMALCDFAHGSLDMGPARVDVDVFMTLEHGMSSMTSKTTTVELTPSPTAQYSGPTQSGLQPYSKATSYIGSAWKDLTNGLHDSESTDAAQSATLEPTLSSSAQYIETTHPALHPYSEVTSYIDSAWGDISAEFQESGSSSLSTVIAPLATPAASLSGNDLVPLKASSGIMGADGTATTYSKQPLLTMPTVASPSCSSSVGASLQTNTTSTWTWPPISSASPSPSNLNLTNATSSNSPIAAQNKGDGRPISEAVTWCLAMSLLLLAEIGCRM